MFGALEYDAYGWIMALGLGTLPLIWFTNLGGPLEPLILLAWGEFSVSYVTLALTILYLTSPLGSSIRDKTGVTLSLRKLMSSFGTLFCVGFRKDADESSDDIDTPRIDTAEDDSSRIVADDGEGSAASASDHELGGGGERSTTRELVREGLSLMFLDVSVQLAKSLAVYLALLTDRATAYQLTALDSNLPSYGLAYSYGLSFTIKVVQCRLLGFIQLRLTIRLPDHRAYIPDHARIQHLFQIRKHYATLCFFPRTTHCWHDHSLQGWASDRISPEQLCLCRYRGVCVILHKGIWPQRGWRGFLTTVHIFRVLVRGVN